MKITKRKNDTSTIRKIRNDSGELLCVFGTIRDMKKEELIISVGPDFNNQEHWIMVDAEGKMTVAESRDELLEPFGL